MGARMREDSTTDDYRDALSGEGGFGSLGYEWSDKPHRLVYDLCGEIDLLRTRIAEIEAALREARSMLSCCGLDEPDDEMQASWDRGIAKVDAALKKSET